ncbi:hypothetical protein ACTHSK_10680, partial [Neisseria sp. P0012.S006]
THSSHLKTTPDHASCRSRLIRHAANIGAPSGWQTLWQGARPRNKAETFLFLEHTSAQSIRDTRPKAESSCYRQIKGRLQE